MRLLAPLALLGLAAAPQPTQTADADVYHRAILTLDTHLDTPALFARPDWDFGARHGWNTDLTQVDLARMDTGALDGGFLVIYTAQGPLTPEGFAAARKFALGRLSEIEAMFARYPTRIGLATRPGDAARLDKAGKRFGYISIENSYPIGEDLTLLGEFYRRGVRMASPVHFRNNQFADSATDTPKWNGLSPLGKQWLAEVNRLGIIPDASHASDAVLAQMIELSRSPVILSHSSARATYDHPRNLGDALIRKLAASGGAICMNSAYLGKGTASPERRELANKLEEDTSLSAADRARLVARILELDKANPPAGTADFETYMQGLLHLIKVAGVDHVCFGADWDGGGGVPGFEDILAQPKVTARLRAAGYSRADIEKMWSGNVLRILAAAEKARGK